MKIKKVLIMGVLLLLIGCRTTKKLVYTVNVKTVIGTWVDKNE